MALTVKEIDAIKPEAKDKRYKDGNGLYLCVSPSGSKWWRVRFFFESRESMIGIGEYPTVSLKEAREKTSEIRKLISEGVNPADAKRNKKSTSTPASTLEFFARKWMDSCPWSEKHQNKVRIQLEKNIFPHFKGRDITTITEDEIREVIKIMETRGVLETQRRVAAMCANIFKYARRSLKDLASPVEDIRAELKTPVRNHFATITHPDEIGKLLLAIENYTLRGTIEVCSALRLAPYVLLRPGNICEAEWAEINFKTKEWHIAASKMKTKHPHIVPLSSQAIEILTYIEKFTGDEQYVFPGKGLRSVKTISTEALVRGLRKMGYKSGEFTTHGFRHMGSTLLNEMDYRREWIELQLAHQEGNAVVRAYNHAQYLPARRKMMQEWADYLDALREKARTS